MCHLDLLVSAKKFLCVNKLILYFADWSVEPMLETTYPIEALSIVFCCTYSMQCRLAKMHTYRRIYIKKIRRSLGYIQKNHTFAHRFTQKTVIMVAKILASSALKRGHGTMRELEEDFSAEDIRHLQLGGYIENGISPNLGETFRETKKLKDMKYFFGDKITWKHKVQNFFLHHLLGFNVAL